MPILTIFLSQRGAFDKTAPPFLSRQGTFDKIGIPFLSQQGTFDKISIPFLSQQGTFDKITRKIDSRKRDWIDYDWNSVHKEYAAVRNFRKHLELPEVASLRTWILEMDCGVFTICDEYCLAIHKFRTCAKLFYSYITLNLLHNNRTISTPIF